MSDSGTTSRSSGSIGGEGEVFTTNHKSYSISIILIIVLSSTFTDHDHILCCNIEAASMRPHLKFWQPPLPLRWTFLGTISTEAFFKLCPFSGTLSYPYINLAASLSSSSWMTSLQTLSFLSLIMIIYYAATLRRPQILWQPSLPATLDVYWKYFHWGIYQSCVIKVFWNPF